MDGNGVLPDPKLIEAVEKFPIPRTVKNVQQFLGLTGYYRKFIKGYSTISKPLTELIKKDKEFFWNIEADDAFKALKKCLTSAPILAHPRFDLPFEIFTDASAYGIGAILKQRIDGKEHVVSYSSRLLNKAEVKYSPTERECIAIIYGCQKFRPYIYGTKFKVVTDHHSLCWLMSIKNPHGRLARWSILMQDRDYEVVYKCGKKHLDADALSRSPVDPPPDYGAKESLFCVWSKDIREEQMKDNFCKDVIDYLEDRNQEPSVYLRKIARPFLMKEGKLFRKNMTNEGLFHRLVIPKALRKEVLFALHDDVTSGHLGFKKTWDKVKKRFFWPKMLSSVKNYVFSCEKCTAQKSTNKKPTGLMQPVPPTEKPFEKIGIDKMGPFPISNKGKKHVIVCTDYASKFVIAAAVKNGTAEEAAKFLIEKGYFEIWGSERDNL